MSGVYDLSTHDDRLRYWLALPTREKRRVFRDGVRAKYGEDAYQQLIDALKVMADDNLRTQSTATD